MFRLKTRDGKSPHKFTVIMLPLILVALLTLVFSGIASAEKVKVRVAIHPVVPGSAMENYMAENKLFEKYAKTFGYDIEVERPPMYSGVVALEGLVAGQLDMTVVGENPASTIVSSGLPIHLGGGVEGANSPYCILVRPESKIGSLQDMVDQKATIALRIASGQENFLNAAVMAAFGKNPADMGLKIVDMATDEAATFPKGLDVVVSHAVTPYIMVEKGLGVILMDSAGNPGPGWKGDLGPDGKVPFFKNALFYPTGFITDRNFNAIKKEFADKYPDLVLAYTLACVEASKALDQKTFLGRQQAAAYGVKTWKLSEKVAAQQFPNILTIGIRTWPWITEGDVKPLVWNSSGRKKAGRIRKEITWDMAKKHFEFSSKIEKRAWEMVGEWPNLAEMTKQTNTDARGYPSWMMDKWESPPSPFK